MRRLAFAVSVCDWAAAVGIKGTTLARMLGINRRTLYRWRKGRSAPTRNMVRALPKKFPKKHRPKLRRVFQEFLDARNEYLSPSITAQQAALAMMEEWKEHVECRMVSNHLRATVEMPINEQLTFRCEIPHDTPRQFRLFLYVVGNPHLKMAGSFSARSTKTIGRVLKHLTRGDKAARKAGSPVTPTNYEKTFNKLNRPPK